MYGMTSDEDSTPTRAARFGEYIARAARAAGYDVDSPRGGGKKALAEQAGMSHASVSRMLAGQTIPSPSFFQSLARAVRVEVGDLFVISGLLSGGELSRSSPSPRPLSPREAASDLGIRDPSKVQLFEAMVRAFLLEQEEAEDDDSEGKGRVA